MTICFLRNRACPAEDSSVTELHQREKLHELCVGSAMEDSREGLRRWKTATVAALIVLLLAVDSCRADELDDLIQRVETVVNRVAANATKMFANRFSLVGNCECSVHACSSEFRESHTCTTRLGNDSVCLPQGCSGKKVRRRQGEANPVTKKDGARVDRSLSRFYLIASIREFRVPIGFSRPHTTRPLKGGS